MARPRNDKIFDDIEAYCNGLGRRSPDAFIRIWNQLGTNRLDNVVPAQGLGGDLGLIAEDIQEVWVSHYQMAALESGGIPDYMRSGAREMAGRLAAALGSPYSPLLQTGPGFAARAVERYASALADTTFVDAARDLSIGLRNNPTLASTGIAIYGFAALAVTPVLGPEPGDTLEALNLELIAAGLTLPAWEEVGRNFEPIWAMFEAAFDGGLSPELEENARGIREMLDTWHHRLAAPDYRDLYDILIAKLLGLLPAVLQTLSGTQLPPHLADLLESASAQEPVGEVLAEVNATLAESTATLAEHIPVTSAKPTKTAKATALLRRQTDWLESALPELERHTIAVKRFSQTSVGRTAIKASAGVGGWIFGGVAAVGGPTGALVGIALAIAGGKIARFVASWLRVHNPDIPGQPVSERL